MDNFVLLIVAFVVLDLCFVGYVFFFRKKRKLGGVDKAKFLEYWNSILRDTDNSRAIMNADKLLDQLLVKNGYSGSVGEKLKRAGKVFSDIDGVWDAHKLRNRVAHEINHSVSDKEFKSALGKFERAFKDLGLL